MANSANPMRSFGWLIVLGGAFSVGTAVTIVLAARELRRQDVFLPEILLPLLLIAGVIALIVALAILVATFHLFTLTDRTKPFGVPEGTLQAIIALILIMIFAITSVYLSGRFEPKVVTLSRLNATQVAGIPGAEIVSKVQVAGGDTVDDTADDRFNVEREIPVDQDGKDFSNQLLTILGTLVGAVAGFYFGAKSVETGVTAGGGNVPPTNTTPPVISGNPRAGESLTAGVGGWVGSPAPSYAHQWQRKSGEAEWADIKGANMDTHVLTADDARNTVRVAITATNSAGAVTAYSPATEKVSQSPSVVSEPTITGQVREGSELTASSGEWAAWPSPSYDYLWERRHPPDDQWKEISGAGAKTYRLVRADVGKRVRVKVTATNTVGSATAHSAETSKVSGPRKDDDR